MDLTVLNVLISVIFFISIPPENIPCKDLSFHIIQASIIAVGNDAAGMRFELIQIIDDPAPEEGFAVFQCWLVDDDSCALGLDAFHDALNGGLAEVIGIGFHGQAEDADDDLFLIGGVIQPVFIGIASGHLQNPIRNKILPGAIGFHDGGHHVLGYVLEVGQQLFGVLGQAVTAVAEGGVVIVGADPGVQAYAVDDILGAQAFGFGIGV